MTIDTPAVPAAPLSLAERARAAESRTGTDYPAWATNR